jgi:hypothetical protein
MKNTAALAILLVVVVLTGGCASTTTVTAPGTTITTTPSLTPQLQPITVFSLAGPVPPYLPAGPNLQMVLANTGTEPIVALSANIFFAGPPSRTLDFVFNVFSTSPLTPGSRATAIATLIGPTGYDNNYYYPVTISATGQSGTKYSYIVYANIGVAPPG